MSSLADAFWDWSVKRYAADGVEPQLLRLQDRLDLNVNILLWSLWCAAYFEPLPEIALRKAIDITERWRREVTGALRTARRALKEPPGQADAIAAAALRETIKDAELAAEKIEQAMLARLAGDFLKPADPPEPLAQGRRNLIAYAGLAGAARLEGFSVGLLDDLARHILPATGAAELNRTPT